MSCPVCNHTMENLGSPERRIFWCPTCGTLKEYTGDFSRVTMPANLRRVVQAASLKSRQRNQTQHTAVEALFYVNQANEEAPKLEQAIFGPSGRRLS